MPIRTEEQYEEEVPSETETRETNPRPSPGTRMLLAASTGGHLSQLVRLAPVIGASDDSLWITFDTPQSRSLLEGRRVLYVPYIAPRDYRAVIRAFIQIRSFLKNTDERFDEAVSTGAGLALAALPAARTVGIPVRYIESVSRTEGPSLSGRILHALRIGRLETQHERWAGGRWNFRGSVLGAFTAKDDGLENLRPKIFVTLGTIRPYRFDSAVDAVLATGLVNETTVWQLGCTKRQNLPGQVFETVDDDDFEKFIREADVVITHSGVGSILRILELGKFPVVLTRRKDRGEHVDDHQVQIAELVRNNQIAYALDVDELTREVVVDATRRRILYRGDSIVH